jgi:hypothetical protein
LERTAGENKVFSSSPKSPASLENQGIAIGSLPAWIHDFESCSHLVLSCLLWPVAAVLETAKTLALQRISDSPTGIDQLHIRKNQSSN